MTKGFEVIQFFLSNFWLTIIILFTKMEKKVYYKVVVNVAFAGIFKVPYWIWSFGDMHFIELKLLIIKVRPLVYIYRLWEYFLAILWVLKRTLNLGFSQKSWEPLLFKQEPNWTLLNENYHFNRDRQNLMSIWQLHIVFL